MRWTGISLVMGLALLAVYTAPWGLLLAIPAYLLWKRC